MQQAKYEVPKVQIKMPLAARARGISIHVSAEPVLMRRNRARIPTDAGAAP